MLPPFPVFVTLVAFVLTLVSKLLPCKSVDRGLAFHEYAPIFVGLVSYREDYLPVILHTLARAAHPDRVKFGLVEYVGHPDDSIVHRLPHHLQNKVHVHTVAIANKQSLARARQLCHRQLHGFEHWCVFMKRIFLVQDWDIVLTAGATDDAIVCPVVSRRATPMFPTASVADDAGRRILVTAKMPFVLPMERHVPIAICTDDLLCCDASHVPDVLLHDSIENRSSYLWTRGFQFVSPTTHVGRKTNEYLPQIDEAENEHVGSWYAHVNWCKSSLGMTNNPNETEAISKYGSVAACRLAVEMRDATTRGSA